MELPPFHLRLIEDARVVCDRYGLLLAGGYAMTAHGLSGRTAGELEFATADETPLTEVAEQVAGAFGRTGLSAQVCEVTPRVGRVVVTDEIGGQAGEIRLSREALRDEPAVFEPCPVVGLDDAAGLAVRSLRDTGLARDFADVAAVSGLYGFRELEQLGGRHDDEWLTEDLLQRLESVDLLADEAFAEHGLDDDGVGTIRRFAYAWAEDIRLRRVDDGDADYDDFGLPDLD
ncbi:hypothetical protein [Planotetraspora mira]|uniref:Nucleotidyl transferase AbiEii/AbiGii toxin family protein n=1 Tax=Planotetraspora mira TaxID=58121 RepID=A0A8J3X7G3_9ACTN|nr:hypothetical protein [Planotetraspora mira]GII30922.1 hypothetical protein Pmi06nite_43640 [Planotetraspora mira]